VPPAYVDTFISLSHDTPTAAHIGVNKTLRKLRKSRFWVSMKRTVRRYIGTCTTCQKRKPQPKHHGLLETFSPHGPFYIIVVDIVGPFPLTARGHRYIVTFICKFTRWVECVCIPDATAASVAHALVNEVICRHGVPRMLLSDQGPSFTAALFRWVNKRLCIRNLLAAPENHKCVGAVEKYQAFLKNALHSMVHQKHVDWDLHVQTCAFAYRTSVVEGINFSPFELVYGRPAVTPVELLYSDPARLANDAQQYGTEVATHLADSYHIVRQRQQALDTRTKAAYDRTHVPVLFSPGEQVLLWTPPRAKPGQVTKFLPRYTGPHTKARVGR